MQLTLVDPQEIGRETEGARLVQLPRGGRRRRHQSVQLRDVGIELVSSLLLRPIPHLPARTAKFKKRKL